MENLGIEPNLESLGGNPIGVMFQPSNIRHSDYKRSYSAHNLGYTSLGGPNLEIRTNTRVRKINFAKVNGQLVATGVTLEDNSTIYASPEVILSAGTIQSPGLLELSGIGEEGVLSAAGIPCLQSLPGVGENLQDHLRIDSSYQLLPNYTSFDALRYNATFASEQLALYNANLTSIYDYTASGYAFVNWTQALGNDSVLQSLAQKAASNPLTSSPFEQTRAHILLEYLSDTTAHVPQIEIIFSDGYTGVKGYPAPSSPLYGSGFFTLLASIQHAFGPGSVHITSPSISTPPAINPNYLAQEYDLEAVVSAANYLRTIANTAPLRHAWSTEYEPGLDVVGTGPDADAQWRDFVINNTLTIFHPVGTCAMLPLSQHGVVDSNLTVYGTTNLRVVDASIFPVLTLAHPQTLIYGISEIAAEKIIELWSW
jgi:choline dehydrogenase-like flavoprotein